MNIQLNKLSPNQVIATILIVLVASFAYINNKVVPTVYLNNFEVKVELAQTTEERELGLSGRAGLENDRGMLFVFESPGFYSFWMKDMRFDLDIIWINRNGKVVEIEEYASPYNFPEIYTSERLASFVLEVNGGTAEAVGLNIGDYVLIEGL